MKLQILSKAEMSLWNEMQHHLKKRNNYHFKKQYYPFRIDLWERENKEIESTYRNKISLLIKERKNETEAANALLLLSKSCNKELMRSNRLYQKQLARIVYAPENIRRSKRIAEKFNKALL